MDEHYYQSSQGRISGFNGCKLLKSSSVYTGEEIDVIVIRENTIITTLSGSTRTDSGYDFLSSIGISGVTLVQGDIITTPNGSCFTDITLVSGSAFGYPKSSPRDSEV